MNIDFEAIIMCAALTCMIPGYSKSEPADLIIRGGRVYTMNPREPLVEAVAMLGNRIVYAGSAQGAESFRAASTSVLDASGLTILPGLIDAHAHLLSLGRSLSELDLAGATSAAQIRQMVLERQKLAQPGVWISGRGWDQNDWPAKEFPSWRDLEGTEANPAYLRRVDGHAAWLNKTGLDLCGINATTPDPPGGRILRDSSGNPTGVLIDNAISLAEGALPKPSGEEMMAWARAAIRECHRCGLVEVGDAGVDSATLEVYRKLQENGELTLRIYAMLSDEDPAFLNLWLEKGPDTTGQHLMIRAIKIYADGALGSRGAALFEPYTDDPANRGLMIHEPDYFYQMAKRALESGFQLCTHAIGDAANRAVLDAYARALKEKPAPDRRLRIEHCQVIALADVPRFGQLDVIASMQPTHATSDMPWAEDRLGGERIKGAYAWRKLLDSGARLAFGSDFPVESPDPLWGIYAAVTRQDHDGNPAGGWHPEEKMTVEEAVRGFTIDAAYAEFAESLRGSIEVGKLADFTLLDHDIFAVSPSEILKTMVIYTIVDGKIVYNRR